MPTINPQNNTTAAPPSLLYGELSKVLHIPVLMYPVVVHSEITGEVCKDTVPVATWLIQAAQARGDTVDTVIGQLCDEQGVTLLSIGQPVPTTLADQADKCAAQRIQDYLDNRLESTETTQDMYAVTAYKTSSRVRMMEAHAYENFEEIPIPGMYLPVEDSHQIDLLNRQMVADYVKTHLKEQPETRNYLKEVAESTARNRNRKDQFVEKMQQVLAAPLPADEYQQACEICPMSEDDYLAAEKAFCEMIFGFISKFCYKVLPVIGRQTVDTCDGKFVFSEHEIMAWIAEMEASGKVAG